MKTGPISKKTMITILVVLVLAVIYLYFLGDEGPTASSLLVGTEVGGIGATELSLLNQMKSLHIDTSLFSDPAYEALVDYSVAIQPEPVGRPDPFAPVNGVSNPFGSEPRAQNVR